jgi:hypothetical protein
MDDECGKCFNKSFASHSKSKFWSKRNEKRARDVFPKGNSKFWFLCDVCDHEFEKIISSISKGGWCPYCVNQKLCSEDECNQCFSKSFASSPRSSCWSSKNNCSPREIFLSTAKKYWFKCETCEHEFETSPNNLSRDRWCPYCVNKKLCDDDGCSECFEKSMASCPKVLDHWSTSNEITARQCFRNSNKAYKFDCEECKHTFEMMARLVSSGCWCNYCANRILCEDERCNICFTKSFASSPYAKYWSEQNTQQPRQVFRHAGGNYWFDCHKCGHTFMAMINNISKDSWCGFCHHLKLCDDAGCRTCFEKSFASHLRSKSWSDKNKKTPRQVTKSTATKYWFVCDKNPVHIFQTALDKIALGRWCPYCKNKTEDKLYGWLTTKLKLKVDRQKRFPWAINPATGKCLPYDFWLPDQNTLIELDGPQHFRQIAGWTPPEETQIRDRLKDRLATKNHVTLIRILQEDVLDDQHSWDVILQQSIARPRSPLYITEIYEGKEVDIEHITELIFHEKT